MRQSLAVLCLAGAFRLLAPAQTSLGMIQPDAGLVFGIEWRKIVDSPAGDMLKDQLKKASLPPGLALQSLEDMLLHDLDSVLIASSASALGKGASRPAALVVVTGRFKVDMLRGLIPEKKTSAEKYRGVDLLAVSGDAPLAGAKTPTDQTRVAFLDANTILAGDCAEVRAAIDRIKTGKLSGPNRGILGGLTGLAADNDVWMIVEVPPNALKDAPPAAAQMFSGVKSTELGVSFRHGFGMQVNVRTKDDSSAQSMAQALQGLLAMAAMGQSESPQAAEMIKKIKITSESSQVKLALALDQSELEKMIKEAQAARTAAPKTAAAPAPAPSGPKSIRISGLDGGPVEVPLSGDKK
jgi:ribosomal protein L12E/L44/L45/RPP1/RPP2